MSILIKKLRTNQCPQMEDRNNTHMRNDPLRHPWYPFGTNDFVYKRRTHQGTNRIALLAIAPHFAFDGRCSRRHHHMGYTANRGLRAQVVQVALARARLSGPEALVRL